MYYGRSFPSLNPLAGTYVRRQRRCRSSLNLVSVIVEEIIIKFIVVEEEIIIKFIVVEEEIIIEKEIIVKDRPASQKRSANHTSIERSTDKPSIPQVIPINVESVANQLDSSADTTVIIISSNGVLAKAQTEG